MSQSGVELNSEHFWFWKFFSMIHISWPKSWFSLSTLFLNPFSTALQATKKYTVFLELFCTWTETRWNTIKWKSYEPDMVIIDHIFYRKIFFSRFFRFFNSNRKWKSKWKFWSLQDSYCKYGRLKNVKSNLNHLKCQIILSL